MIRRRGQGAMEYLMTYGWAILVVMVVGIVMWQLGIFNLGGVTSTTSTGFPRVKVQLALVTVNSSGHMKGAFTNGAGGPIKFNHISCSGDYLTSPDGAISVGDNFEVNGECPQMGGTGGGLGDPFEVTIILDYNVTLAGSTITHRDFGTVRGPIE